MGTWNTKINGNDTFQEIYQNFFDAYNQGKTIVCYDLWNIKKEITWQTNSKQFRSTQ